MSAVGRTLVAVDAKAYVICAEFSGNTYKVFRITCEHNGSIYVNFPYIPDGGALLGEVTLGTDMVYPGTLRVGPDFATTVHKVKYAHHPDGEAHFSQSGKILTRVRRKAVPFDHATGHLFTVMVEGVVGFNELPARATPSRKAQVIPFGFNGPMNSIKFVGMLYTKREWASMASYGDSSAPWLPVVRPDGGRGVGIALTTKARRQGEPLYLLVSAFARESTFVEHAVQLVFMGGFDPPDTALDHTRPTSYLMLLHPPGSTLSTKDPRSIDFRPE